MVTSHDLELEPVGIRTTLFHGNLEEDIEHPKNFTAEGKEQITEVTLCAQACDAIIL